MIQTQEGLEKICNRVIGMPWVALDTEFERVSTYYPRLCLIQIGTPQLTACIDPTADIDLSLFGELLSNHKVLKVLHSARQDLEVLGITLPHKVNHIFDTQIAAQFCGYGDQVSYGALVKQLCGVTLAKAYTRSQWCRRPLSHDEIRYALDDARYLGPLYQQLRERLMLLDRKEWVYEDCKMLAEKNILQVAAETAINKFCSRASRFSSTVKSIAFNLAVWRESEAQRLDKPREWIISSVDLLQIALAEPRDLSELRAISGISKRSSQKWRDSILKAVEIGIQSADNELSAPTKGRLAAEDKKRESILWSRLKEYSIAYDISVGAIGTRSDIRKLSQGMSNTRLLQGWRKELVGVNLRTLAEKHGAEFKP